MYSFEVLTTIGAVTTNATESHPTRSFQSRLPIPNVANTSIGSQTTLLSSATVVASVPRTA
jgi:hypothetical protein